MAVSELIFYASLMLTGHITTHSGTSVAPTILPWRSLLFYLLGFHDFLSRFQLTLEMALGPFF